MKCQFRIALYWRINPLRRKISGFLMISKWNVSLNCLVLKNKPVASKDFTEGFVMISKWNVSFELPLLKNKPVASKDFKFRDDFDMKCQFRIAFNWRINPLRRKISGFVMISIWDVSFELPLLKNEPVTSDDVKRFDDLDMKCQFGNAFIEE